MKSKHSFLILLLVFCQPCFCQEKTDTAAMIKEFKKVMEFTRQPFVYVTTTTTVQSQPVLDAQDTLRTQGVFYKNETDLYYSTGQEEMYLQDSLLVQVNHDRKTIWISRNDAKKL